MEDTFKRELELSFADEQDCWNLLSGIESRSVRGLKEISEHVSIPDYRVRADTGSTFGRDSLDAARLSLQENDAQLSDVTLELRATSEPNSEWTWIAKLWVHAMLRHGLIVIEISGKSRVAVEGLAGTLSSFVESVAEEPSLAHSNRNSVASSESVTRATVNAETRNDSSSVNTAPLPARSWWAATWRDHTAGLVVTVVGGVLVIAVAVAIGIAHP